MISHRTLLFTAIILTITSIANADLILTINGVDAAKKTLEIEGKEDLIIAVAGESDAKAQNISVTCDIGKLEPLLEPNALAKRTTSDKYLFHFTDEIGLGIISLNVDKELVYQLVLFFPPETDTVIAFGMNLESLSYTPSQPQSEQQISPSQTTEPEKSYFATMSAGGTTGIDSFPDPNSYPNLNNDDIVNFIDFSIFAANWQQSGSGLDGDFDNSGTVDANDLATLAYFWLNGPHPLDVFDSFKAALAAGDVNEALTFVTEISRDKYTDIFQIIEPNLPDYAAGMGELIFDRQRNGEVIYEMLHQDGGQTLLFPVFFIRDYDKNWGIYNF